MEGELTSKRCTTTKWLMFDKVSWCAVLGREVIRQQSLSVRKHNLCRLLMTHDPRSPNSRSGPLSGALKDRYVR